MNKMLSISIVIPCFNEENNINALLKRLHDVTSKFENFKWTYIFVDDGSQDGTFEKLKSISSSNKNIKILRLSRNFGSHIAISAGIENSNSDAVISISADLQEPPELIEKLIHEWKQGYQVVLTIRKLRAQKFINKALSRLFSKIFRKASGLKNFPDEGPSGYFLIDKKVADVWHKFKETNRTVVGLLVWAGFNQTVVGYEQAERFSGKSSYTFMKLIKLSLDLLIGFSFMPIRIVSYVGILVSFAGFLYIFILIFNKIFYGIGPSGWTSIMVLILFLGGIILITLGMLGEYLWRTIEESRRRPLYLIMERVNFDKK